MSIDLFAGISVTDYRTALEWYERLFGSPPSFLPNDTEAVWEVAEHRFVFIELRPEHAGHARHLVFVGDLDTRVAQITERGLVPSGRETLANGVRKAAYRDPDGNEFEFGGAPLQPASAPGYHTTRNLCPILTRNQGEARRRWRETCCRQTSTGCSPPFVRASRRYWRRT